MRHSPNTIDIVDASDLSVDDLVSRAAPTGVQRVSLYLPTHTSGRDVLQDPVRLRHSLDVAATEVDEPEMLDPARQLLADEQFWAHGSEGLGILIDADGTTAIRLPESVPETVVASDRFHLKPLLPIVDRVATIEILALSRHAVRLVRAHGVHIQEIEVPGLPAGMPDALQWDDRERQLQSHATGRVGPGRVTAAFHGQGGGSDLEDADLTRFLHAVDRPIAKHRADSRVPLVLAGVDELVAAFRAITRCHHVVGTHLPGNPDRASSADLAERACRLVPPNGSDRTERARESFLRQTAATVDSIEQAVIAAAAGQVESVFVPVDRPHWGFYRPGHSSLVERDERRPGDHDLADVAASETIRHGGLAFAIPADEIPGGGSAAATLHF